MQDSYFIPNLFINHAADTLADTLGGLTGSEIVRYFREYAINWGIDIPHTAYPFDAPNKGTALKDNLLRFLPEQQYTIIKELCELERFKENQKINDLKIKLLSRYPHLAGMPPGSEINETLIEETRHWLERYPDSLKVYNEAFLKFQNKVFTRNLLDDLRLSLELLLKGIFENSKSLENQIELLGEYLKGKGGSKELTNMFVKLVDYYSKY